MVWLFYILATLLLVWALMAASLVAYSVWASSDRAHRADLRAHLREALRKLTEEVGSVSMLSGNSIATTLKQKAGSDRKNLRDFIIEATSRLDADSLQPFCEAYEILGFIAEDVKILQTGNWQRKVDAAIRLGRMRCLSAIEVLNGALRDGDKEVRLAAVCALAEIGDPSSVSNIVYSLSGANGWQVLQVADKLINMRIDISHLLLEMLQSSGAVKAKREAVSKTVLELIADFGQRSSERFNINLVRSAIMQFMNSDSIDLKARAIRAFAAVGIETGEELEAILLSLTDKHWEVRAVAARALGQIGLEGAVPYLANSLMDEAWWVRHNAAHSLARLGQQGIDALREKLDSDDRFARDISKQVIEELQLDAAVRG